jgi:hypothetical protein
MSRTLRKIRRLQRKALVALCVCLLAAGCIVPIRVAEVEFDGINPPPAESPPPERNSPLQVVATEPPTDTELPVTLPLPPDEVLPARLPVAPGEGDDVARIVKLPVPSERPVVSAQLAAPVAPSAGPKPLAIVEALPPAASQQLTIARLPQPPEPQPVAPQHSDVAASQPRREEPAFVLPRPSDELTFPPAGNPPAAQPVVVAALNPPVIVPASPVPHPVGAPPVIQPPRQQIVQQPRPVQPPVVQPEQPATPKQQVAEAPRPVPPPPATPRPLWTTPPAVARHDAPRPIPFVQAIEVQAPAEILPENNVAPAPLAQQSRGDTLATGRIKSIRQINIDITPPDLVGDDGERMPAPVDYASEWFAELPIRDGDDRFERDYDFVPIAEGLEFCYQPLYFEEVNVERYGRNFGLLQPVVSAAHFYSRIPTLPYHIFAQPARRCTYHAHWTLPGYRVPWWERKEHKLSACGLTAQTAAAYGVLLLIP